MDIAVGVTIFFLVCIGLGLSMGQARQREQVRQQELGQRTVQHMDRVEALLDRIAVQLERGDVR